METGLLRVKTPGSVAEPPVRGRGEGTGIRQQSRADRRGGLDEKEEHGLRHM